MKFYKLLQIDVCAKEELWVSGFPETINIPRYPSECGHTLRGTVFPPLLSPFLRKRLTQQLRESTDKDTIRNDVVAAYQQANLEPPQRSEMLPGAIIPPIYYDVAIRPNRNFIWSFIGMLVASNAAKIIQRFAKVTACDVTYRTVGDFKSYNERNLPDLEEGEIMDYIVKYHKGTSDGFPQYQLIEPTVFYDPATCGPRQVCSVCGQPQTPGARGDFPENKWEDDWQGENFFRLYSVRGEIVTEPLMEALLKFEDGSFKFEPVTEDELAYGYRPNMKYVTMEEYEEERRQKAAKEAKAKASFGLVSPDTGGD